MRSETARSRRLHNLAAEWSKRAESARAIERQFDEWGNTVCAEVARAMRREIERCRDEMRAALYPIYDDVDGGQGESPEAVLPSND